MLEAKNLTFRVKDRSLINNISMTFKAAALYGILGPNGSGKTTLLKNLSGIWLPSEGTVTWQGQPLFQLPRMQISRIISLVPQAPQLSFNFTAAEMVAMGRYAHKDNKKNAEMIEHSLISVDAWHLRDRPLMQLSGGERQRIYIARALATEAPVILLDEPTSHLDLRHQLEIWDLLRNLTADNRIIITAVHDLLAAKRFCEEVAILNRGECIASGSYASVMEPDILHNIFGIRVNEDSPAFFDIKT